MFIDFHLEKNVVFGLPNSHKKKHFYFVAYYII